MGFFRKIMETGQAVIDAEAYLVDDPFLGDPVVHEWAARLDRGEDVAFRAYLAAEPDLERRDFTIQAIASASSEPLDWVDRWVADEPESALAHMVLGVRLVHWAWVARTGASAKHVKREQFEEFFVRLERSWEAFERAIELDPEEASTYAMMIDCAKGLNADLDTRIDLYDTAQELRPWQQVAHSSLIQALAKKWGGSKEGMLEFARHVTESAPEGSTVHVVIPEAHVEIALDEGDRHLRRPEVLREIVEAAERSVDSTHLVDAPSLPRVHDYFGYCFWLAGEHERARREFERAGPYMAGPFRFLRDPMKMLARARREVGAPLRP